MNLEQEPFSVLLNEIDRGMTPFAQWREGDPSHHLHKRLRPQRTGNA